ncbi:MAG: 50S ribosomal protein L31 [Chloroflexota bacterium]|nr:50S ribosomal protein L31 [Chloroflexota bacterium]
MKPGIHPNYIEATVTCACGNVFTTRSTKPQLRTDLCSVCHPFYTGEQRIVDSAGQVERFMRRMEAASSNEARPSKRQVRLTARASELEEQRLRAEEAAAEEARQRALSQAEAEARSSRNAAAAPDLVPPTQPAAAGAAVTSEPEESEPSAATESDDEKS